MLALLFLSLSMNGLKGESSNGLRDVQNVCLFYTLHGLTDSSPLDFTEIKNHLKHCVISC